MRLAKAVAGEGSTALRRACMKHMLLPVWSIEGQPMILHHPYQRTLYLDLPLEDF
jgi:hypothetical protein